MYIKKKVGNVGANISYGAMEIKIDTASVEYFQWQVRKLGGGLAG